MPLDLGPANGRLRRISPVAAHSGDRLLSEPTAGTQPWQREPLLMPHFGPLHRLLGQRGWRPFPLLMFDNVHHGGSSGSADRRAETAPPSRAEHIRKTLAFITALALRLDPLL
jgi:hypothetical protein